MPSCRLYPLGFLFLLGCPLQSPSLPHPLRNTQEFLPLGNDLLTHLLSNNPVGSGALLPSSNFPAFETSICSPVHLTLEDSFSKAGLWQEIAKGTGSRKGRGGSVSLPCGVFAISYPCLSGVRVERDGRVQGQRGCGSENHRVCTAWMQMPEVKSHQSGNSHQSLPHLPIVFPWKLTKPHCVLGLLISVL